ncbi:MAG: asparagine synthase (glutamine-hydrolyzing) [Oscillospiraceae bacterium]|nr:asparagine synthase (glutamine-hydrolyzing) [Oscillospiraceae bacterium]
MSGFAGIYKKNIGDMDKHTLGDMSASVAHRGPKSAQTGVYNNNLALAFRHPAATVRQSGEQSLILQRWDCVGVLDGAIYNYSELHDELIQKGRLFDTDEEIEVLLALYREEGVSFFERLRGMFAIVIYDLKNDKIIAGRDRFGIKPFYYAVIKNELSSGKVQAGNKIIFASEMKAFIHCFDKPFSINKEQLQHYMTFQYVPEPKTITDSLKILDAGSYFEYSITNSSETRVNTEKTTDGISIKKYSELKFTPDRSVTYDQKVKRLRKAIESSVELHMRDCVEIGAFLSSGVDSAVTTALSSRISPGIKAFTIAFHEHEYSELNDASGIAKNLDVEHIKLDFTFEDFISAYDKVIYHLDAPVADPSAIAIYILCREASKYVGAVLSGEGSDELFGGYRVYNDSVICEKIYNLPSVLRRFLAFAGRIMPGFVKGKNLLLRGTTPLEQRYVGNAFIFDEKQKADILTGYDPNVHFTHITKPVFEQVKNETYLTKMQYCDISTWVKGDILVKGDRLSMANALEIRTPYLDTEVWEAAKILCNEDKLSHKTTKYIFRDAFRDILGEEHFMRPKLGFPVPVRKWLKNEMYEWARNIIMLSNADEFIIKSTALKLLDDHRSGKSDNYRPLWTILVFLTWYEKYVSRFEETKKTIANY